VKRRPIMQGGHDRPSEEEKERELAAERKPYKTPGLIRHGTVAEVTKAGNPNPDVPDATGYAS
jgi:hypothetical protein